MIFGTPEVILTESAATPRQQDLVGRGGCLAWVVAEKSDDSGPVRGCRSHLITFPALIVFAHGVHLSSSFLLSELAQEPTRLEVLAQRLRFERKAFLAQITKAESASGHSQNEMAKLDDVFFV